MQLEYNHALEEAELTYKQNLNGKLSQSRNIKTWWKLVKNILGKGSSETCPALEHCVSGQLVYDKIDKANLFNNFFSVPQYY